MRQMGLLLHRTFDTADCRTVYKITVIYCNIVHIYCDIIFYTKGSFVLSSRVCEAGLHLCTDLFLQVLTQAEESGAPPIKRVRSETLTSMQGRHCLGKCQ
jgi:hypothetical protein